MGNYVLRNQNLNYYNFGTEVGILVCSSLYYSYVDFLLVKDNT